MHLSQSWVLNHRHNPLILNHHYLSPLCGKDFRMLVETPPVDPEAMRLYSNKPYLKPFRISLPPLRSEPRLHVLLHRPDRPQIRVDELTFRPARVLCAMQDKVVPLDLGVSWSVLVHAPREMDSLDQITCRITFLCLGRWTFRPLWPRGSSHPG